MPDSAELELGLSPAGEGRYALRFRFWQPGDQVESTLGLVAPLLFTPDTDTLRGLFDDPERYGSCLAGSLFADPRAGQAFEMARELARSRSLPLRIRLYIDPAAPDLHALRWETLRLPPSGGLPVAPLFTDENLLFSRYLPSTSLRPVPPPDRSRLRALVVIANPAGLPRGMAPVEVEKELARARAGLEAFELVELAQPGQATLDHLLAALREEVDVFYLVAHGGRNWTGQPIVLLEDADGAAEPLPVSELARRVEAQRRLPLLAVLVSCLSAAGDDPQENVMLALGPSLVGAGVPAVLAMQGRVRFDTMDGFLPVFFRELQRDWQLDRALAAARNRVRDQPDWWMPVLFSRLRDNQLPQPPQAARPFERLYFEPETLYIPAGPFIMGRDPAPGVEDWETPAHLVDLPAYRIGKYPVTVAQFAEFIRQTGEPVNPETGWDGQSPPAGRLNHPVTGVTWYQALKYCAWLSEQTGRRYVLPSEAQWEKAARGPQGWLYPWGNEWQPERCAAEPGQVAPVDRYPPQSPPGCCDLVGNAREWTASLWGQRRSEPDPPYRYPWKGELHNDLTASSLFRRVYRGGAAGSPERMASAARGGFSPDKSGPPGQRHGFRVVLLL